MEQVPVERITCRLQNAIFHWSCPITRGRLCFDLGTWGFPGVTSFPRFECRIGKLPTFVYKNGVCLAVFIFVFIWFHLGNTEEMALFGWETFSCHLRSVSWPPLRLAEDHWDLCPDFVLADAKEAARDFHLPELVQATFY